MSWSAQQYIAFEVERTRPVRDLLAAVPVAAARFAIDLGCGPGNSTAMLVRKFPSAEVSGIDSSADMIDAARRRLPAVRFSVLSIQEWTDLGPFDVILANAVFQWVPGHSQVLPSLLPRLAVGGALAIQMPDNLEEAAHYLMRQVAEGGPWAPKLGAALAARTTLAAPEWYYALLRPGCAKVEVWQTTYYHRLAGGPPAIVEWFKGTGLRPFIEPLSEDEQAGFLERYMAAVAQVYKPFDDGSDVAAVSAYFRGGDSLGDCGA